MSLQTGPVTAAVEMAAVEAALAARLTAVEAIMSFNSRKKFIMRRRKGIRKEEF